MKIAEYTNWTFLSEKRMKLQMLTRYLLRSRVESGEALKVAREEYRSRNRRTLAQAALPEAWRELVEKGDELLVELLADAVESKAGIRPEDNDVVGFLEQLKKSFPVESHSIVIRPEGYRTAEDSRIAPNLGEAASVATSSSRHGTLILMGKKFSYNTAKDAMVTVLRELAHRDETFLERCSKHPSARGSKRRYLARSAEELYPDRPEFQDMYENLPGGWLIMTNLSNASKKSILKLAADVAELKFGKDIVVDF